MADPLAQESFVLYGLPRAEFTAARAARAKELRDDDPELAAAVAALPKPSVASDALNALVREDPSEIRALVQSGKRLRAAQEAAVAGKAGQSLSAALVEHRAALERILRDLGRRKLSGPTFERAAQTVRAASLDPELQPLLERGTLYEDLTGAGFGLDPALVRNQPKKRLAPVPQPKPDRKATEKKRQEARKRLAAAERGLGEAEKQSAAALAQLERAKQAVEQARHEVQAAS